MSQAPGIGFFDLDRTVIAVNSASLWIKREVRLGFVTRPQAVKAALWIGAYHFGFARMEDAIRDAIATMKGDAEEPVVQRTLAFWREEIVGTIRPGARAAIARHQERGEPCVLLTSSSQYLSRAAAEELGLDAWLCNHFEVEDGVFTGAAREPLCFGPGKITYARAFAQARGVPLDRCTFYTDSMSDLPVLLAVGTPVAIDPDPRLAREARRRGWRVEDWNSPGEPVSQVT